MLGIPLKVRQPARVVLHVVEFIQSIRVIVTHQPPVVRAEQAHAGEAGVVQIVLPEDFRALVGIARSKQLRPEVLPGLGLSSPDTDGNISRLSTVALTFDPARRVPGKRIRSRMREKYPTCSGAVGRSRSRRWHRRCPVGTSRNFGVILSWMPIRKVREADLSKAACGVWHESRRGWSRFPLSQRKRSG